MNIGSLNLLKSPEEGDQGRKEKNGENEPIWVITHIYMDMSQGNSLYSYLKETKNLFFQNWRTGRQNRLGFGTSGKGRIQKKGIGG
jgi:hypothetical protein